MKHSITYTQFIKEQAEHLANLVREGELKMDDLPGLLAESSTALASEILAEAYDLA